MKPLSAPYPTTPDGRYFVVRGRLWRTSNPALDPDTRDALVKQLMDARRALRGKGSSNTGSSNTGSTDKAPDKASLDQRAAARAAVDAAKTALGERGPVWWTDGAPDYNRKLAKNTPYAQWFQDLPTESANASS
ncbi:hypothetical protein FXN63_13410 [Pigmentiphaga aceris]|uniref:Uncharacterized protein n=1 Tax=Pigmentiphaga aceris TaxID=1940612 RepID=A0A5C0AYF3_9BURK|nr:hypothetical protein [Pigmentiphaga aceris]QEI06716.1 hypothetical protein FXN63_13410 [Pigmentiphaga aceris]